MQPDANNSRRTNLFSIRHLLPGVRELGGGGGTDDETTASRRSREGRCESAEGTPFYSCLFLFFFPQTFGNHGKQDGAGVTHYADEPKSRHASVRNRECKYATRWKDLENGDKESGEGCEDETAGWDENRECRVPRGERSPKSKRCVAETVAKRRNAMWPTVHQSRRGDFRSDRR